MSRVEWTKRPRAPDTGPRLRRVSGPRGRTLGPVCRCPVLVRRKRPLTSGQGTISSTLMTVTRTFVLRHTSSLT